MLRLNAASTVRSGLSGWTPKTKIQNSILKHPSALTRHIAVLTEAIKNDAELYGGLKTIDSLPGPRVFPILGNLEHIKTNFLKMHITQLEDGKKYGPMYKDQILATPAIVVQDPDLCQEVYRAEGKLPHRDFSLIFEEFLREKERLQLPKSFVALNGEEWAELRRKFNKKMLAPANMKAFYPLFSDIAVDAVACIRSLRDENSIVNDVREQVLGKWALESIGKFVYGFRTGLLDAAITDESKRFYEAIKVVLSNSVTLSRSKWIKYLNRKVYNELKYGMKNWYNNGVQQTKRVMDLVQNAEKMGKDLDESIANSLICHLMFTKNMSIDECNVHSIELYGAGYDTTTTTVAWLLYWLGMNPDKQEILYNEVVDKVPEDGRITDDAVQQMPYLRACIKESARLTPMAFNNIRAFPDDMVLNGYIIPAHTQIFLSNYNMGRNDSIFPNANSFVPERWLRENKENYEIHPYSSLPFGYGARACLGRRIAEAEIQVLLAQMVKRLKIRYAGGEQDGDIIFGITLPQNTFAFYDR